MPAIDDTLLSDEDRLRAENAALRAALRTHAIHRYGINHSICRLCDETWPHQESEQHNGGCLAAPGDGK